MIVPNSAWPSPAPPAQSALDVDAAMPLIAALLSIPTGDRYPLLAMTPQRRKDETLQTLLTQLAGLAAREPVLMMFEDAHWIDPTSIELLGLRQLSWCGACRSSCAITFRPEFVPPWTGQPHVTSLLLERLSRLQGAKMVARLTDGRALPTAIFEQIVVRTDGVPLFVEELTKMVLELGPAHGTKAIITNWPVRCRRSGSRRRCTTV